MENELINLKINGRPVAVTKGSTILEAAQKAGIRIPTLCYLREINAIGSCRICVVEVKGAKTLVAACVAPAAEGMEVLTNTVKVHNCRRITLELILSTHKQECLSCTRTGSCELQKLCHDYKVEDAHRYEGLNPERFIDDSAPHMVRDDSKCILCRRCSAVCENVQGVGAIGANERGFNTHISCAFEKSLEDSSCISCGQCVVACPTGALCEKDETDEVWAALSDPTKHVLVQTAPSIRVTLGEAFDMPIGTDVTGKMVAALRRIGFEKVFDTDLAADMTIVEEATEFIERVKNGGVLPMITSCSPGWVHYCERFAHDMIPHLSTCKSPQQMFGATVKTWYAQKMGWDPKDIFMVGIMPCTAKKFEVRRDDQCAAGEGIPDVDVALTTRELAHMIERAGIRFHHLPDESFDSPMGQSSGAAVIFGATGGVMEAALRSAAEWLGAKPLNSVVFSELRGTEGIKEATYNIGDLAVNVAVASGLGNAKKLLEKVRSGEKQYHFIEIMGCPGGCVNGGGQPMQTGWVRNFTDLAGLRAKALYNADSAKLIKKSHENAELMEIYKEFYGEFGSHLAHKNLHTSYVERSRF